jgi:DNA modification methylase
VEGNLLYYGDNLDVLRRHIADESVDLVYLDPPFKSNQDYNVLFAEHGVRAAAQIKAFEDTWSWDEVAAAAYDDAVTGGGRVADAMVAFRRFLGDNDMLAYLSMMAPRLLELRRVLRSAGSIYLHCDPAASHYLKMLMDAIFGAKCFRNEIVWKRATTVKGNFGQGSRLWSPNTDSLLFYTKTDTYTFHQPFADYSTAYVESAYRHVEAGTGRRYRLVSMIGPGGAAKGNPLYEFLGVTRYWRYSQERMQELFDKGLIVQTKPGTVPNRKYYLDEGKGVAVQTLWDDIGNLQAADAERLGYPTQKPVALLERIIQASSDEGDTVLDPFCGCGTTVAAAQHLNRRWIGIDVTHLAIGLIKTRMHDTYSDAVSFKVIGEPTTEDGAEALAASDPYQFQFWALGLVGARPVEQKKGADRGIDGRLYFNEGTGDTKQIIISVKAGKLQPTYVDALVGVVQKEGAQIGALISFNEPTKAMRAVAASAGFYESPTWGRFPAVQLLTVRELLADKGLDYPRMRGANVTYKKSQAAKVTAGDQLPLVAEGGPDEPYDAPDSN